MAPGLTYKHNDRLESLTMDKHSSLLQIFVNYDCKKFLILALGRNKRFCKLTLKEFSFMANKNSIL